MINKIISFIISHIFEIGVIFMILSLSIYFITKNNTKKKTKKSKTTTTNPPPPPSTSKKTDWWKTLKNVLWTLLALFLLILIGVWIAQGVKKLLEPGRQNQTHKIDPSVVIIRDDTWIEYGNLSGFTYKLPENCEFELLEASEPYCVTNGYGKTFCGQRGEDVTNKMPYSYGNLKLKFKSTNGKIGRLKINIIK